MISIESLWHGIIFHANITIRPTIIQLKVQVGANEVCFTFVVASPYYDQKNYFLDQELIPYQSRLVLLLVAGTTFSKKNLHGCVVSNRIGMKFGRDLLQV